MSFALGFGLGLEFPSSQGEATPPPTGPLQIDSFPILVDTFEITFA